MAFIFRAIASIFDGGGQQQQPAYYPPLQPTPPPPAPPPPDRSDSDIQAAAERARRSYGIGGGRADNSLTGGIGIPTSSSVGAITSLLGGVGR